MHPSIKAPQAITEHILLERLPKHTQRVPLPQVSGPNRRHLRLQHPTHGEGASAQLSADIDAGCRGQVTRDMVEERGPFSGCEGDVFEKESLQRRSMAEQESRQDLGGDGTFC